MIELELIDWLFLASLASLGFWHGALVRENGKLRRQVEARNAGLKVIGDINRQLVEENTHQQMRFDGIRERLENLIWLASENDEPDRDGKAPGAPCGAGSGDCSGGSCGRESSGGCEDGSVSG